MSAEMSVDLLRATRSHDHDDGGRTPFISVVLPVRNEERFIAHTLSQLLAQDYDPLCFELLVVDGCSSDRTREIVAELCRRHPQVQLLHNPKKLSSAARNIG